MGKNHMDGKEAFSPFIDPWVWRSSVEVNRNVLLTTLHSRGVEPLYQKSQKIHFCCRHTTYITFYSLLIVDAYVYIFLCNLSTSFHNQIELNYLYTHLFLSRIRTFRPGKQGKTTHIFEDLLIQMHKLVMLYTFCSTYV